MDIKRVLTSVLGLPAVIAIIVFGNTVVIDVFFGIIALISLREYYNSFEKGKTAKPIKWIGYLIALSIGILRLFHLKSSLIDVNSDMLNMMFSLIIVSVFAIFFHILNSGMKTTVQDGAITIFGIMYIPVFIMFLPMLIASSNGKFLIWYVMLCGWGTDVFAYLAGKIFSARKHKFSKVSPNKSIEGCIAGSIRCSMYFINLYNYM